MQSRRKRKTLILSILVVGLFVIWTVVPIYMLISQSVKPESIMFADPPKLFYQPIFDHFVRVFVRNDILGSMINSVIVSVSTMVFCVVLGSLCAYSLARIKIPGSKFIALFIILTRTVPAGALMMPMYVLMRELGLYDLTPAMCHLDYTMAEAGGAADFVREYTLASGGPYCDCGYKKKTQD